MLYRTLRMDELEGLRPEFVNFLAANGIVSQDWLALKEHQSPKVNELIDAFSDHVFDTVLERVKYLEQRTAHQIWFFYCPAHTIYAVGLRVSPDIGIDFTQQQSVEAMVTAVQNAAHGSVQFLSTKKSYGNQNRKRELFKMMEEGCLISDGLFFKILLYLDEREQTNN